MYGQLIEILSSFWQVLGQMSPYLLFGFLMAGVLSVLISAELIERHLGGRGIWPVLKASAFGVPLPLCSCGVIPVSASLRRHGSSRGATTAFLISTPQTGVDGILVTFSLLGWIYALFRPILALATGLVGGTLVDSLTHEDGKRQASAGESCCEAHDGSDTRGRLRRVFSYGYVTLPRDIGKALLLGLAVAALIGALVPKDYFASVGTGLPGLFLMMLVGIPVYVCATASVPVAAALILHARVSPGAALAFLMTGPATNAATIATVWKVMGKRTATVYLLTMVAGALAGGLILDSLISAGDLSPAGGAGEMLPRQLKDVSAILLLGVLGAALLSPLWSRRRKREDRPLPHSRTLIVEGMHCQHCADSVERALREQHGVSSARVDLAAGKAVVQGTRLQAPALVSAVKELGYSASLDRGDSPDEQTCCGHDSTRM